MYRMLGIVLASALLVGSPAMAGGSMEQPTDRKAPETNKDNTDTPANVGRESTEPKGMGKADREQVPQETPESSEPSGNTDQTR